jgi:hypothetical protein
MAEWTEGGPPQSGGENESIREDVATQGDEGERSAAATPPIGEDAQAEQTTSPPAEGEVGVASDEELGDPESAPGSAPDES